jgi:hypothetical protein
MTAVVVVLTVAVALLGILVFGLLRNQAQILALLRQSPAAPAAAPVPSLLPVGAPAPEVRGTSPTGAPARVDTDGPVVLAFLTGGCQECARWWAALAHPDPRLSVPVAVVTPSPSTEPPGALARVAPPGVGVVMATDAWDAYGVQVAGTVVVVAGGRLRAGGRASTWDDLAELLGRAGDLTAGV